MKKNNVLRKGIVYCLIDPFDHRVRYVGFTIRTLKQRIYQHNHTAKKQLSRTSHQINWYRSCLKKGKYPIAKILESNIDYSSWADRENYWINKFEDLTNYREGGCGVIVDRSSTSIQRSANSKKKKVVQLSLSGDFIKLWDSAASAAKELNLHGEVIGRVCSDKYKIYQSGNFRWVFYKDYKLNNLPKYISRSKLTKDSSVIKKKCYVFCAYTRKLLFVGKSTIEVYRKLEYKYPSGISSGIKNKSLCKYLYYISFFNSIDNYSKQILYFIDKKYYPSIRMIYNINKDKIPFTYSVFHNKMKKGYYKYQIITNFNEDIVRSLKETLGEYPI